MTVTQVRNAETRIEEYREKDVPEVIFACRAAGTLETELGKSFGRVELFRIGSKF